MKSQSFVRSRMLDTYLGKEFETTKSGKCFIVDYVTSTDVTVAFYAPICFVKCRLSNLKDGRVFNPLTPVVCDRGYMGVGGFNSKNNKAYAIWSGMFTRAYNPNFEKIQPTYKDVEVCEEWWDFQNFAKWCHNQKGFMFKDYKGNNYHLDKDILVKGNKVYSPETCCFVPQEINSLFALRGNMRGNYSLGVRYSVKSKKYIASRNDVLFGRKYLGSYNTEEEAFQAYKADKDDYIKSLAEKWKGKIDDKAYQALLDWKVEITD